MDDKLWRSLVRGYQASTIGGELAPDAQRQWLDAWFQVIRRLPAAKGCDAELVVTKAIDAEGDDIRGSYDPGRKRITVYVDPSPYENLATLVHETAHAAQYHRHHRHHGYSWRRTFVRLAKQLTEVDISPLATAILKDIRAGRYGNLEASRERALDLACIWVFSRALPTVHFRPRGIGGRITAQVGDVRHVVDIDPEGEISP